MYKIYNNIGFESQPLHLQKNLVVYSAIDTFEKAIPFNNFSIKYVMSGIEKYTVNNEEYVVKEGEYILCNPYCEGQVSIDSKTPVEGICIELSMDIVSEAVASHQRPDNPMPHAELDHFFKSRQFYETLCSADNTILGQKLKAFHHTIGKNPNADHSLNIEFYYGLAEDLIADCVPIYKQLQSIPSQKASTKKDILRRLSKGKNFIDQHFTSDIYVEKIASESLMSQFHFYRLFKKVYGKSPYQYIKEKRLMLAKEYLMKQSESVTDIALKVGYADLFSFSKGYKQFFGKAPSDKDGFIDS